MTTIEFRPRRRASDWTPWVLACVCCRVGWVQSETGLLVGGVLGLACMLVGRWLLRRVVPPARLVRRVRLDPQELQIDTHDRTRHVFAREQFLGLLYDGPLVRLATRQESFVLLGSRGGWHRLRELVAELSAAGYLEPSPTQSTFAGDSSLVVAELVSWARAGTWVWPVVRALFRAAVGRCTDLAPWILLGWPRAPVWTAAVALLFVPAIVLAVFVVAPDPLLAVQVDREAAVLRFPLSRRRVVWAEVAALSAASRGRQWLSLNLNQPAAVAEQRAAEPELGQRWLVGADRDWFLLGCQSNVEIELVRAIESQLRASAANLMGRLRPNPDGPGLLLPARGATSATPEALLSEPALATEWSSREDDQAWRPLSRARIWPQMSTY